MNPLLVWAAALLMGIPISAHHSLSGTYDMDRQISVEGVVREFQFVNPHPFVILEVTARGSDSKPWQLELDNRYELAEIGITAQTFKAGDRVIVRGNPGRAETQSIYVTRLDRPSDRFRYEQIGTTPRVGRIPG